MNPTCWHLLGITPTNDTHAIRKAYAVLLKTNRPDDDAAAYQTLREAFDEAMRIAPYQSNAGFKQPETPADTAMPDGNDPYAAWIEQAAGIASRDGAAGLIRERIELTSSLNAIDSPQRDGAERFWLDYLRSQNQSLPLLWTFGATWFGWWDEQGRLSKYEYNELHERKYYEADWVHSPEACYRHLLELDGNPQAMQQFWNSYPDEIQAFTKQEQQQMGLLLRHWRNRSNLPETLRTEWQTRYPEFDQELPESVTRHIDEHLVHIQQSHAQGGIPAVWAMQPQTDALLDSLPAIALPVASQKMLQLLRQWQTRSPHLWNSWGRRFDWSDSPFSGCQINETEREYFYHQCNLSDILHDTAKLADYLDESYRRFNDGRAEIGYIWSSLKDDLWALSAEETAQLHHLMRHYLQHHPHRLNETVFADWYAQTEQQTTPDGFRQSESTSAPVFAVTLTPQDVVDYAAKLYQGNGDNLRQNWPNIRTMLEQLPLGTIQQASRPLLHFLRENRIDNPIVWAQWADYFGWATDYQTAQLFSVQEMEELKIRLETAAILHTHTDTPNHGQTPSRPITQALQALAAQGKTWRATCLGWLLYYEWLAEWNHDQRRRTIRYTALSQVEKNAESLYIIRLVCLITAALISWLAAAEFGGDVFILLFGIPILVAFLTYSFWGVLSLLSNDLFGNLAIKVYRLLRRPKVSWAIGVVLPALSITVWTFAQYPPLQIAPLRDWIGQQTWLPIGLLAVIWLSWNLHALELGEKYKWIILNTLFIGLFALTLQIEGWGWDRGLFLEFGYTSLWAILWLNTAILLRPRLPQTGSLNILSNLICLPHTLMQQLQHKSVTATLEQAAWVLMILSITAHFAYPQAWLAFYPIVIGVILCGHAVKRWAKNRLTATQAA